VGGHGGGGGPGGGRYGGGEHLSGVRRQQRGRGLPAVTVRAEQRVTVQRGRFGAVRERAVAHTAHAGGGQRGGRGRDGARKHGVPRAALEQLYPAQVAGAER